MSLLGFDAIGRLALGQLPQGFVLVPVFGSFALTGEAILIKQKLLSAQGSFALTGEAITSAFTFVPSTGNYVLTGEQIRTIAVVLGVASNKQYSEMAILAYNDPLTLLLQDTADTQGFFYINSNQGLVQITAFHALQLYSGMTNKVFNPFTGVVNPYPVQFSNTKL